MNDIGEQRKAEAVLLLLSLSHYTFIAIHLGLLHFLSIFFFSLSFSFQVFKTTISLSNGCYFTTIEVSGN
jgi:hypothetical protein